jgi:DNA polymerase III alpha subunit
MSTKHNQESLVQGVLFQGPQILEKCLADINSIFPYLQRIADERLDYPVPLDSVNSENWLIPKTYQDMDIEEFLLAACPKENHERLITELELYRKNDMISVLKAMKYIVDTLKSNGIVWGVGRGSSVSSYVLYLIGVHRIDSVKYKLPIEEFFKGEENG